MGVTQFEEFNCYKCGENSYKVDRPAPFENPRVIDPYVLDFECLNCGNKFIVEINTKGGVGIC